MSPAASLLLPAPHPILTLQRSLQVARRDVAELSPALRNQVVVLDAPNANGKTVKVYLMGVSHVSKLQAEQVRMHAVGTPPSPLLLACTHPC